MRHPLFTEEHELFRDAARKFVDKELAPTPTSGRGRRVSRFGLHPDGELGYLGLRFPEKYGGRIAIFFSPWSWPKSLAAAAWVPSAWRRRAE